jgi:hypothetical protein
MANVGSADRIMRFVLGALLIAAPFVPPLAGYVAGWGEWKFVLALVGAVLVGTAAFRFCPAYMLFGVRTCAIGKN